MGNYQALNLTYQKTEFALRHDADGKVFIQARAAATLTAKTPVLVIADEYGYLTKALADGTWYCYVGIPLAGADSGDVVWLQTGGYIEDVVCASDAYSIGHGVEIHDGALRNVDADYSGLDAEFAVSAEAGTVTSVTLMLIPRLILTST